MGKGSKPTIGFWYHVAYHHGLTIGPLDAFLEYRGGDKTAWSGELTSSGTTRAPARPSPASAGPCSAAASMVATAMAPSATKAAAGPMNP